MAQVTAAVCASENRFCRFAVPEPHIRHNAPDRPHRCDIEKPENRAWILGCSVRSSALDKKMADLAVNRQQAPKAVLTKGV